jgi:ubiquitin C-terminal hydrolase
MSNAELSVLSDHDNTNHLSHTEPSQYLTLQLQYNDRREGSEKLIKNVQFSPATTIRDVIRELIKYCRLEYKRPEDINLIEITHDKSYHVPVENAQMTLNELNIDDGCTLCFQPTLTCAVQECAYLQIWSPNNAPKIDYKWYKSATTLGELLEYVIQKLSLESIERERIHLFYELEEMNLSLNYDKLLKDMGVRDNAFIDVEIIPPIEPPISSSNNATTYGLLTSLDGQNIINRSLYTESSATILLQVKYTDQSQNLNKTIVHKFLPTTTIDELIRKFLNLANLNDMRPEDINLVGFGVMRKNYSIFPTPRYKTLMELNIQDGHTLSLEPSITSISMKPCSLTIQSLDNNKKAEYKWDKTTTTLGMLLDFVIEEFSLKSIERKRICLTTLLGKSLDHTLSSDTLLNDLGITNLNSINMKIMPSNSSSTDDERSNVRVKCTYTNGTHVFYVPHTTTIEELKKQIEKQFKDHFVTEMRLFNRMHDTIDTSNLTQKLSDFGIESGQTVYVPLKLVYSRNPLSKLNMGNDTTIRSSSLIAKQQPDEVTVICKVSTTDSMIIKTSPNDTVAELLKKLENFKKTRPFAQLDMWCGSNNINTEQLNRRLSDFGIEAGDTIDATLIEKPRVKYTLESSRGSTSLTFDNLSRNQRFTSTPLGLYNIGNTCYMNSALQCLAHANPLTQFFLDGLTQNASEDDKGLDPDWNQFYTIGTVTGAYADVLRNLWLPSKSLYSFYSYRPDRIKETIGHQAPRFATYDQQDAQEFLNYLLDEIHKELKEKNGSESSTIIEELFFGKIQSTVTCKECQHQVKTTNIISFLPLPLNQHGRTFNVKFIARDGINDFTIVSVPQNGQVKNIIQAYVESRSSPFFYHMIIVVTDDGQINIELPLNELYVTEVMLVEQDDFIGSQSFDQLFKTSKKLTLDDCLQDFCSLENLEDSCLCQQETCQKHTKATKQLQFLSLPPILIIQFKRFSHEDGLRQKIETFVDYPIEGLDLTGLLPSSSEDAIYDLFAVSNHIGSIYGGHYTAYAQHELNGRNEWYKFDDSYATEVYNKKNIVSKDAYLLFYIKRNKSKQSTTVTTS